MEEAEEEKKGKEKLEENISNKRSRKRYSHSTYPKIVIVNILKCFLPIFPLVFLRSESLCMFALFLLFSDN